MKHPQSSSTQWDLYSSIHQTSGKIKLLDQKLLPYQSLIFWSQYKKLKKNAFCGQSLLYTMIAQIGPSDFADCKHSVNCKFNFTLEQAFMIMKATLEVA